MLKKINDLLAKVVPMEAWTCLQFNRNTVSKPHADKGNRGVSAIVCAGDYAGGEFVINDKVVIPAGDAGRGAVFRGQEIHESRGFDGLRYSVIMFNCEGPEATLQEQQELQPLGFPMSSPT